MTKRRIDDSLDANLRQRQTHELGGACLCCLREIDGATCEKAN